MTLLAVVAHPDDETFGCGSILMYAAQRTRTVVACLTRGESGELAGDAHVGEGGLAELRESELRSAAALLGVDEVEVLGFEDSGMDGEPSPGSLAGVPFEDVVSAVRDLLARHRPSVVVALDGSDGHRDHLRLRDAVLAAAGPDVALYLHCLPRSLMHRWILARHDDPASAAYVELPDIGTPDEDVTTLLDTGEFYDRRLEAIALHRSQASPFDGLPEDLKRDFLATEHLHRVQPPWPGREPEDDLVGL
jgi:LmbE family N-acetylglucosaminyl deacetylase